MVQFVTTVIGEAAADSSGTTTRSFWPLAATSKRIELRFFGGLSVEETAAVLDVSVDTVMRDWKLGNAWLLRELRDQTGKKAPIDKS